MGSCHRCRRGKFDAHEPVIVGTDGNGCWKVTCHRMLVAVQLCRADALGAEICHFTGTSDYHGHVAVTTNVAAAHGVTTVDVAGTFEATTMFWPRIRYLVEEMSTWQTVSYSLWRSTAATR